MYYPYKVIVNLYRNSEKTVLEGFGQSGDEGNFIFTAKRLVKEYINSNPGYLKGLETSDRISVKKIPENIRKNWPSGIITIPVYYFEYSV